jgi:hypothetical protein
MAEATKDVKETPLTPEARKEVIQLLTGICASLWQATLKFGHEWCIGRNDDAVHSLQASSYMRSRIEKLILNPLKEEEAKESPDEDQRSETG